MFHWQDPTDNPKSLKGKSKNLRIKTRSPSKALKADWRLLHTLLGFLQEEPVFMPPRGGDASDGSPWPGAVAFILWG